MDRLRHARFLQLGSVSCRLTERNEQRLNVRSWEVVISEPFGLYHNPTHNSQFANRSSIFDI